MNNDIFFFVYGPFPSCTKPLFQREAKWEAIDMKMIFYIFMQIKLIITRKVLHLASFSIWESFGELENGLFQVVLGP